MKEIVFYEAFAFDPSTCDYDLWMGTATVAAIRRAGLRANLAYPYYGDETLGEDDGWACRARV
jgi:hypothetical protein